MGKKGASKHLKRMPAPEFWPIHVKEFQWITKPRPGPHSIERSLPVSLVIRDILHYARTYREARRILSERKIKIDGKIRIDKKFPIGLMDIIEIPDAELAFRVVPIKGKGLSIIEIPKEEKSFKLCQIKDKNNVKGGNVQLQLHDGRSILIKINDPKSPKEDVYKTRDTLQITVPEQKILKHLAFKEKSYSLVTDGRNIGRSGKIIKIEESKFSKPSIVTVEDDEGNSFQTTANYVLVVGENEPLLKVT
jgi:small subunit ribosomal protein S4e